MNDKIFINEIEIFAKHGVYESEKLQAQRFLLSVCAKFDASEAMVSDEISQTVSYTDLLRVLIKSVQNSSFNLIERLARHIADEIFLHFNKITSLELTIAKFPESLSGENFSKIGFHSTFLRNG